MNVLLVLRALPNQVKSSYSAIKLVSAIDTISLLLQSPELDHVSFCQCRLSSDPNPISTCSISIDLTPKYRVTQKTGTIFMYALTLPNINRFSKLFHYQNEEKIYNNAVSKDPTTPEVCRYTTL